MLILDANRRRLEEKGIDPNRRTMTPDEIFNSMQEYHRKRDLISIMEQDPDYSKLSDDEKKSFADGLVDHFEKALSRNDAYWDAYWQTINAILDEDRQSVLDVIGETDKNLSCDGFFADVCEEDFTKLLARIDFKWELDQDSSGQPCIALIDLQGADLGGIESERFYSVESVFERMDTYWIDEFLHIESIDGEQCPHFMEAITENLRNGDIETARLIAVLIREDFGEILEKCKVTKISAFACDAEKHIDLLYENDLLSRLSSGKYVIYQSEGEDGPEGWYSKSKEDLIKDLVCDLNGLDSVRQELETRSISLPAIEGFLLHGKDDPFLFRPVFFDDETAYGEPQMWMYLYDGTSLEITHEEYGIDEGEQYFSVRHHCSDSDFENDAYKATCGVISQISSENLLDVAEEIKALINKSIDIVKKDIR